MRARVGALGPLVWWALFAAGVRLAEWLPAPSLYAVARLAGRLLALVPTAARSRLRNNLSRVTGQPAESAAVMALATQVYVLQTCNYVDLLRTRKITPEEIGRRFVREGPGWDLLLEHARTGTGSLLVSAHFGRIERLNHFLALHRLPVTLPVERLSPPRLFDLVSALRTSRGVKLVPHDAGLRPWLRAVSKGDVVALFAEWDPSGRGVPVDFFGAEARFPPGPAFLALRSGAPLFIGYDLPGDRPDEGRVFVDAPLQLERTGDMDRDVQRATQQIAQHFERTIGRHPGRWVMFHDIWQGNLSQSAANRPLESAAQS
jgi:phosphatidylinositol dimannoside acyltransferase